MPLRRRLLAPALLALLAAASTAPQAQPAFPNGPVTIVVPYGAGGGVDFFARTIAGKMGEKLGQPVIVENKPGAGTAIAAADVARARPDGQRVLIGDVSTLATNPTLYKKLSYDPAKDLVGISLIAKVPLVFLATPASGIKTLAQMVQQAKAAPGRLNYASAGIGGSQHLSGEMLKAQAGVFITHIPYRGSGPAQADFLGNQVPLMVDSVTAALANIQAGRAVPLAVTSATRSSQLPQVPTVRESGVAGLKDFEAVGWLGLMAPHGTPAEIVARLNQEVVDILGSESMAKFIRDRGSEPAPTTGPEFDRFIVREMAKWGVAVKASGATAD